MLRKSSKSKLCREEARALAAIANGKKRCDNCDQLFDKQKSSCPHCKEDDAVPLSDAAADNSFEEDDWIAFEGEIAELKKREFYGASRKELVKALFTRAMEVRYKHPHRSRELFWQVVQFDPENYEARIKISWQDIRLGKMEQIKDILEPVIHSETATPEQKKRAYNNICCYYMFAKPAPDYTTAGIYAKKGIDVDDIGTDKLWENYASVLIHQCKYVEAREALKSALILEPKSVFAQSKLSEVEKNIKFQEKQTKKSEKKALKENQENTYEVISRKNSKGFLMKRVSKTSLASVQFC